MDAYVSPQLVGHLLPEILLLAAGTVVLVGGAFHRRGHLWHLVALAAPVLALLVLWFQRPGPGAEWTAEAAPLALDPMARFARITVALLGVLFALLVWQREPDRPAEYAGALLLLEAGAMLTASAANLVMVFLALELVSIPSYVLLYLVRRAPDTQEATIKYFLLSILSSALMLYGFSFLYGVAGATHLAAIRRALAATTGQAWLGLGGLGMLLVLAGLGFKLAAVPFHFYAPDVYQGTTHENTAVLAAVPKLAAAVVLVRLLWWAAPGLEDLGWRVVLVLALVTMTLGNTLALWQNHLRRLLAYSSVAHAGYMLVGLAAAFALSHSGRAADAAVTALLFYALVYAVATAGIFAVLAAWSQGAKRVETVEDLAGLSRHRPGLAAGLAVLLFSLAGIPPLAGFWGKFGLFSAALQVVRQSPGEVSTWFVVLAVVGVLNAAAAAAYYLRIIGTMYFQEPGPEADQVESGGGAPLAAWGAVALVVLLGLVPRLGLSGASRAGAALQAAAAAAPVSRVAAQTETAPPRQARLVSPDSREQ